MSNGEGLLNAIDEILTDVPTDVEITVALRYGGPGELIEKLSTLRSKLEELRKQFTAAHEKRKEKAL